MITRLYPICGFHLLIILLFFGQGRSFAQTEIPLGEWRMHLSYNSIHSLTYSSDKIYGAAESGIVIFDKTDNSLSTYTKLTGLSGTGISCIHFDLPTGTLIVAYNDGNIDLIKDDAVTNFDRLKTSNLITGSKKINHISTRNGFAYLAADFGLVVFDLTKSELKETWRDIGASGAIPMVRSSTFIGDSIFIATDNGVQAGNINMNLLDFNNWKRFESGVFANDVEGVTTFNSRIYAAVNSIGILTYVNGTWTQESYLPGLSFNLIHAGSQSLFVSSAGSLWSIDASNTPTPIAPSSMTFPQAVIEDAQQKLWIGDSKSGMLSNASGTFTSYSVNGPTTNSHFRIKYHDNTMYAVAGGFSPSGNRLGNPGTINTFFAGQWSSESSTIGDITDLEFYSGNQYRSSFGDGIEVVDASGSTSVLNELNSPLQKVLSPDGVFASALELNSQGLWVSNYRASQPLRLLNNTGVWESFGLISPLARYATEIKSDFSNNLWLAIDPAVGGGLIIFNKEENFQDYFFESPGAGNLPSRNVFSLAVDRDGSVWVGTQQGIAFFYDKDEDAVKPIFENRFLLRDEKITAIEVDGANRKWIGTERGVWLFNPSGDEMILNFTVDNSPLLSNRIQDIEISPLTGEVFFVTDKGIVSYRGDATSSTNEFSSIKIFPNPVTAEFSGAVNISGLATDAYVKITDVSGKLIWQTRANGGTATWNVRDYNGTRAATGVYLVFAANLDSSESVVGKIVVVQ
jgi:hypothetical protein